MNGRGLWTHKGRKRQRAICQAPERFEVEERPWRFGRQSSAQEDSRYRAEDEGDKSDEAHGPAKAD